LGALELVVLVESSSLPNPDKSLSAPVYTVAAFGAVKGIAMDSKGNLYGTATYCYGTTGGVVFKLTKSQ
jgi:hypothetical protein